MRPTLPPLALATALAALVLWAPLPFASVTAPARTGLEVAAGAALLMSQLLPGRSLRLRGIRLAVGGLAALSAWAALQAVALPAGAARLLSPQAAALRGEVAEILGRGPPERFPLSLAPDLSLDVARWLAALAALLLAAHAAALHRRERRVLAAAVVGAALFQALYGARRWTAAATTIWGVDVPGAGSRLRGTFVNPNHLALLLAVALAVTFAWAWAALRRSRGRSIESRLVLVAPPLLVWLALFATLAFTGSRAGLAAAATATVLQGLLVSADRRRWRLAPAGLVLLVVGLGYVAAIGLQQGLGRWLATSAHEVTWSSRLAVYRASVDLWRQFALVGTGAGSFRDAFRLVQPTDVPAGWWHAHNDWLELLVTCGLVGAACLLVGLLALVRRLLHVLASGERSEDRAAAIAALGALTAAAVHSGVDFGLTIPANALVLAVVCGAAARPGARQAGAGERSGSQPERAARQTAR